MKTPYEILTEGSFLEILGIFFIFQVAYFFFDRIMKRKLKKKYILSQIDVDIFEAFKNFYISTGFIYNAEELAKESVERFRQELRMVFPSIYSDFSEKDFKKLGEHKYGIDSILEKINEKLMKN